MEILVPWLCASYMPPGYCVCAGDRRGFRVQMEWDEGEKRAVFAKMAGTIVQYCVYIVVWYEYTMPYMCARCVTVPIVQKKSALLRADVEG